MSRKPKKSRIPKFRSFEEEAKFWDEHDTAEFLGELGPAKLTFARPRKRLISLRLPESEILSLKKVARRRGLGYLTMMRMWVTEKLLTELKRAA